MKIIVGLGNPGDRYRETRHNVGFRVLDELAARWRCEGWRKRFEAEVAEHRAEGPVLLVKPQTYMNRSGIAVRELARFYKVPANSIVVVHDDLDLPTGRLRIRERGGAGGHRGIESMLAELGSEEFARVKLGIGRPPEGWETADYVLAKFATEELPRMQQIYVTAADAVELILREGPGAAMNRFNRQDATQ